MRTSRLPYFRFYVWDYLNDPVVLCMDADAEGCYVQLLARAWDLPEPGVIPEGMVARLARLERITDELAPDAGIEACPSWDGDGHRRQLVVLDQLRAAFDTESRPGYWIQRRMVQEHSQTSATYRGRKLAAIATNKIRGPHGDRSGDRDGERNGERREMADGRRHMAEEEESKDQAGAGFSESLPLNGNPAMLRAVPNEALSPAPVISALADRLAMEGPRRTPLLDRIRLEVSRLEPSEQRGVYQLAAWLAKKGVRDDELVLRFVADCLEHQPRLPFAYYAVGGPAWNTITGHWNADAQDNESRHWREQDRAFVRSLTAEAR